MKALPKSWLLQFVEQAVHLARRAVARYSSKFSKRQYTLHQHIVLLCLKIRKFNRLNIAVWQVLLNPSVTLLPTTAVVGIDASGFDRTHASKHYTKRTKLTIQQLKVTLLVDTGSNAILDLHVTTTRKHDSQIAPRSLSGTSTKWRLPSEIRDMMTRKHVR